VPFRIARVLTRLNLGGPARQVLASDPALVERGHVVRVFAGRPEAGEGDLFDELRERGIDVVRVPEMRRGIAPAKDLRARAKLRAHLVAFGPDVVHTHASKAGTLGRMAARAVPSAARVHTFHGHVLEGYFPELLARRLRKHEAALARETDRVVAVSHATANDLVRLGVVAEERLVVVPPGVDLAPFLALPPLDADGSGRRSGTVRGPIGAAPGDVVCGVIGRLAAVKRCELALRAFALLGARRPELHVAFVGDGEGRRALERAIAALPADARRRAHLLGNRRDMPAVLADLDLVLASSRAEGLPIALIEAAAAALPVVATGVGGVEELVAHERTGLVASAGAPHEPDAPGAIADELAFHVDRLLGNRAAAAAMGRRARVRVAVRYSGAALADRLEELYSTVTRERRGGHADRA
jgi:glycosyltransferase involved in cell wall biosynthesis